MGSPRGMVRNTCNFTHTLQLSPGILQVWVWVTLKMPEGYSCQSLFMASMWSGSFLKLFSGDPWDIAFWWCNFHADKCQFPERYLFRSSLHYARCLEIYKAFWNAYAKDQQAAVGCCKAQLGCSQTPHRSQECLSWTTWRQECCSSAHHCHGP